MTRLIRWSASYDDGFTVACAYCDPPLQPADQPEGVYSWVVVQADGRIVRWGWCATMAEARRSGMAALREVRG